MIRNPKKNSNFLKPYLSNNKNVNVSITVMSTPAHIGILKHITHVNYEELHQMYIERLIP